VKPIVLYGAATHDNEGDLAMMRGLIGWLAGHGYAGRLVLLTRNPDRSERDFAIPCRLSHDTRLLAAPEGRRVGRVRLAVRGLAFLIQVAVWKYAPAARRLLPSVTRDSIALLANSEAVVVHGSGSFNSVFWRGWLYPKAITAIALRWLGTPLVMTSQGIGPFSHPLDKWMARRFLGVARICGVRDGEASRGEAIRLGADPDRVIHTGDDSALLPAASLEAVDVALAAEGVPRDRPLLGVNFRDASSYSSDFREEGYAVLAAALDSLIEASELQVVFLPISYDLGDGDRESADRVAALMKPTHRISRLNRRHDATILRGMAGRMTAFVGTSYHALLFALSSGVPVLALTKNVYYASKHRGLLEWFGCAGARVDMDSIDAQTLADKILELLRDRDHTAAELENGRFARVAVEAQGRSRLLRALEP
jgi:colanic acid/amylovoran biosynthesis protein